MSDASSYERRLAEILGRALPAIKEVPLPFAMRCLTGRNMVPALERPEVVAFAWSFSRRAMERIQRNPIEAGRPNEVGNAAEQYVIDAVADLGGRADSPVSASGRRKSAGYPDLEVFAPGGARCYVEVKTYRPDSTGSSFRSFYLSPSSDPKVAHDAPHLLVAFGTEQLPDGRYSVCEVKLLDLSRLKIDLKVEIQASNADMYGSDCLLSELNQ